MPNVAEPIEPPDPAEAEATIRELDAQLQTSRAPSERAGVHLQKAVLLGLLRRFGDSRRELRLAHEAAPHERQVLISHDFISAGLLHEEGNLQGAFSQYSGLLQKWSDELKKPEYRFMFEDVQTHRAFEAADLRDTDTAIPLLQEILEFTLLPERRAWALAQLGVCLFQTRKYQEAKNRLTQSLTFEQPLHWEGHLHFCLALTYAHLKQLTEAKKELLLCEQRCLEWGLSIKNIYGWLSRICGHLGETDQSKEYERLARGD